MHFKYLFIPIIWILIISCSNNDSEGIIEKKVINNKTYYVINSVEDLYWLSNRESLSINGSVPNEFKDLNTKWSSNYLQVRDIIFPDSTSVDKPNSNSKNHNVFQPIGDSVVAFTGNYNGTGHIIKNLVINNPEINGIGLFGTTKKAKLDSIHLINSKIIGKEYVGNLIGYDEGSTISGIIGNGNVKSKRGIVGGLIGLTHRGIIDNCNFNGKVESEKSNVGGILGILNDGIITNSNFTGKIEGESIVGGIVGSNSGDYNYESGTSLIDRGPGSIENCSSNSQVFAKYSEAGGIVGSNTLGTISDCIFNGYVRGNSSIGGISGNDTSSLILRCENKGTVVANEKYAGGIIGEAEDIYAEYDTNIYECMSNGIVIGKKYVGGIVGYLNGSIASSYTYSLIKGNESVGGIVGYLHANKMILESYSTSFIDAENKFGSIAGEIYGSREVSEFEVELLSNLQDKLQFVDGIKVVKRNVGDLSQSLIRDTYWDGSFNNIKNSVGEVMYGPNGDKKALNSSKNYSRKDFFSKNVFSLKSKNNSISEGSPWIIKNLDNSNNTYPFLKWQKVILQEVDDTTFGKILIYNNSSDLEITEVGYLLSDNFTFQKPIKFNCELNSNIQPNSGSVLICSENILNKVLSKGYKRSYARTKDGKEWYGPISYYVSK